MGFTNSPSMFCFGRGVAALVLVRCDAARLSDGILRGDCIFAMWFGEEKLRPKSSSWACEGISADLRGAGLSNKFSSAPEGRPACKLLRLGFGVLLLAESNPVLVSRRLSGLGCVGL
jgi:hypothetical protein